MTDRMLDTKEAAEILRMGPIGVRSLICRKKLTPDGRGSRGVAMFFESTLIRFMQQREQEWRAKNGEEEAIPGSETSGLENVRGAGGVHVPEDGASEDAAPKNPSVKRGRSKRVPRKARVGGQGRYHADNASASAELRAIVAARKG